MVRGLHQKKMGDENSLGKVLKEAPSQGDVAENEKGSIFQCSQEAKEDPGRKKAL